ARSWLDDVGCRKSLAALRTDGALLARPAGPRLVEHPKDRSGVLHRTVPAHLDDVSVRHLEHVPRQSGTRTHRLHEGPRREGLSLEPRLHVSGLAREERG